MGNHLRIDAFGNGMVADFAGVQTMNYTGHMAETDSFEEIFRPSWWRHFASANGIPANSLVTLIAADRSFDVDLRVEEVIPGGLKVSVRGGRLPKAYHGMHDDELKEIFERDETDFDLVKMHNDGKPVSRVEQLPDGWRIIGNDNEVISKSLKSKSEADNRHSKYLYDLKLKMPSPAESAAHKTAIEARVASQNEATAKKSAPARK